MHDVRTYTETGMSKEEDFAEGYEWTCRRQWPANSCSIFILSKEIEWPLKEKYLRRIDDDRLRVGIEILSISSLTLSYARLCRYIGGLGGHKPNPLDQTV